MQCKFPHVEIHVQQNTPFLLLLLLLLLSPLVCGVVDVEEGKSLLGDGSHYALSKAPVHSVVLQVLRHTLPVGGASPHQYMYMCSIILIHKYMYMSNTP